MEVFGPKPKPQPPPDPDDDDAPCTEAYEVWEFRKERFEHMGYTEGEAALAALTPASWHQVETEIADLIARGCKPETARRIARP